MRWTGPVALAIALQPLAACKTDSVVGTPAGFSYSAATRDCAPNDGAAVAVYLGAAPVQSLTPTAPYIRIVIWKGLDSLTGRSWSLAGGAPAGAWLYSTSPTVATTATAGAVTVTSVSPDRTVDGAVDITFANGRHVVGSFSAPWVETTMLCG